MNTNGLNVAGNEPNRASWSLLALGKNDIDRQPEDLVHKTRIRA